MDQLNHFKNCSAAPEGFPEEKHQKAIYHFREG